jgi:hypothetical protein
MKNKIHSNIMYKENSATSVLEFFLLINPVWVHGNSKVPVTYMHQGGADFSSLSLPKSWPKILLHTNMLERMVPKA